MAITVQCGSCNKKFKANDQLAGKRVKCPQCGGAITIPALQPAESPASMASLLDEESVPAKPVAAPKPQPAEQPKAAAAVKKCPSCSAEITAGAVLCVNCGLDLRTGKPVEIGEAAAVDASDGKKKKRKKKKKRGDTPQAVMFLRGCAFSFLFAFGGVVFWWLGATFTGVGASWILSWLAALAIGGLAGTGMSVGYDIEDLLSGIAAAVIAFVAIVGGRILIFVAVVLVVIAAAGDSDEDMEMPEEEFVAEQIAESEGGVAAEEMVAEDTSHDQGNEEIAVDKTTGQNVAVDEMDGGDTYDEDAEWDEPEYQGSAFDGIGVGALVFFFITMFSFGDLILLPLSCYVAYHVGSGEKFD